MELNDILFKVEDLAKSFCEYPFKSKHIVFSVSSEDFNEIMNCIKTSHPQLIHEALNPLDINANSFGLMYGNRKFIITEENDKG